ncbi:MAG: glycosyl hydrolase family 28 protein, partial [Solirubrobacteraceae bacterium]
VQDGDDCVAIKSIPVLAPSSNITVRDVHCYGTHGISIGSQTGGGISNILVRDDTLSGTDSLGNVSTDNNGIRIKSDALYGGVTQRVSYEDVCMTGIKHLLYFNPHYAAGGTTIPTVRDIVLNGVVAVNSAKGAYSLFQGYDASHPLQIDLENIQLDNTTQTSDYVEAGLYNSNVVPSGPDVTVTPIQGYGSVPSCQFPSFGYPAQNGGWWHGWHRAHARKGGRA